MICWQGSVSRVETIHSSRLSVGCFKYLIKHVTGQELNSISLIYRWHVRFMGTRYLYRHAGCSNILSSYMWWQFRSTCSWCSRNYGNKTKGSRVIKSLWGASGHLHSEEDVMQQFPRCVWALTGREVQLQSLQPFNIIMKERHVEMFILSNSRM